MNAIANLNVAAHSNFAAGPDTRMSDAARRQALGDGLRENEPLAPHTTFRVGGPADYFLRVDTRDELVHAVIKARALGLRVTILGNGSNILVADRGIRGLVIDNHADAVELIEEGEWATIIADSGALLPGLANRLARQGWSGLEWAIGVPGTIGAGVVNNAGAHGGAIADSLTRAEILDRQGNVSWWANEQLRFAYRSSILKQQAGAYLVVRAEFRLAQTQPASCIARMNQYTEHRRRTQPTEPSVGSMFKNPPGDYAGRLIEAVGLKGVRIGQVQVSDIHANFFVNRGGATAAQVAELVERVRRRVREQTGVTLELEIELLGDW